MTQDEIIRMAIDAGLGEYLHLDGWRFTPDGDDIKSLERFYELAYATGAAHERELTYFRMRAAGEAAANVEREACAKVCEESRNNHRWDDYIEGCEDCAAAIRARS